MTSSESADLFARSWSLYDHITEHNYMFHQEIYAELSELLKQRHDAGQYHMLDLGCGNARYLVPALMESLPGHYQGVDLSQTALDEAADYLAKLPSVTLTHGDLLRAVESTSDKWDVIFTGYALHHLPAEDKAKFFQAAARCLSAGGWLVMVTHSLGSDNLIFEVFARDTSGGTNSVILDSHGAAANNYGAQVQNINTNSVQIQLGNAGLSRWATGGSATTINWNTQQIKVVVIG